MGYTGGNVIVEVDKYLTPKQDRTKAARPLPGAREMSQTRRIRKKGMLKHMDGESIKVKCWMKRGDCQLLPMW